MEKKFLSFLISVLTLTLPSLAFAHPGIELAQWPGHVLTNPIGGIDHVLAILALVLGFWISVRKQTNIIARLAGAVFALAGLLVFIF